MRDIKRSARWLTLSLNKKFLSDFSGLHQTFRNDHSFDALLVQWCPKAQGSSSTYVPRTKIYNTHGSDHKVAAALLRPKRGLVPPALDAEIHIRRSLMQLRSKDNNLEKYIYLSHLKNEDTSTFYKLCLEHMPEITPIIYTPTVGDACLNFSHIYRRPEGLVRI